MGGDPQTAGGNVILILVIGIGVMLGLSRDIHGVIMYPLSCQLDPLPLWVRDKAEYWCLCHRVIVRMSSVKAGSQEALGQH